MRILQVCFRLPFPLKDGGAIAMFNMTKGFSEQNCFLKLLVPITNKHRFNIDELPDSFKSYGEVKALNINSDITFFGVLKSFFVTIPYYVSRYYSKNFRNALIEILKNEEFDIIHFESLKVAMYAKVARKYSNAKLVLRSHNVEYLIWQRQAQNSRSIKKIFLHDMSKKLKKYETDILEDFDALVPITQVDADYFLKTGFNKPVHTSLSGIDFNESNTGDTLIEPNSFFHIGALDWMPNLESVKWFLTEIWPLILIDKPEAKFYIAGRNTPDEIKKLADKNVIVAGEVEDASHFMKSKQIMVVPLLAGSGMRIKVAEGLALGKVIISTSIGAEGIEYSDGINILIANTPEMFRIQAKRVLSDISLSKSIERNAILLAKSTLDNTAIVKSLLSFYSELVGVK